MSLRSLAIAAGVLVGLALPTAASASYTTGAVNLRGGPGTNYYVITTVPPGAFVSVRSCVPRWCRVTFRGLTGWMSSAYIARGGQRYYRPKVYYPRPYVYPQPYVYPRYVYPRPYPYPRYVYPRPYPYAFRYRGPDWGFSIYGR